MSLFLNFKMPKDYDFLVISQVGELESSLMCPPSEEGLKKEMYMKTICLVLTLANIIVFTNLLYDYYQYKTHGVLPQIVYWIPYL